MNLLSQKHRLGALAVAIVGCATGSDGQPSESSTADSARPNFVVIVVDDLRWDELGVAGHPYLETPNIDRLAAEGAYFTESFHAVALCSPNRASILTGQYPSQHGIIDNVARNRASHRLKTFPQVLQQEGYETGFLGKWHMGNDPTPRPGFDFWSAIPGQGRVHNPIFFEDGGQHEVEGYITDIITDRAIGFIEQERTEPFFLYIAHKAIHPNVIQLDDGSTDGSLPGGFIPADRHAGRYSSEVFPRRANVPSSIDEVGSAAMRSAIGLRTLGGGNPLTATPETDETTIRGRAEMLLAVDEGLGRILETLEQAGTLDQTVIILTSDNGYFYGEHGLSVERRMPFDESIRNPLLIRYPPAVEAGRVVSDFALTVDIAPTVLELAGAPIGEHIQGRSLLPILRGEKANWRKSILVEFYTYENPFPWLVDMDYRLVRTKQYKYVHWIKHPPELYDLAADPFETHNVIDEPGMASVARTLRSELGRLTLETLGLDGG